MAGWCHDLGKLGSLFQQRLDGLVSGVDHSSAGAHLVLKEFKNLPTAVAIQGHHIGLQSGSVNRLRELNWSKLIERESRDGVKLSSSTLEELLATPDWNSAPILRLNARQFPDSTASEMLYTRILFSCLVDADFVDTESHFQGDRIHPKIYRESGHDFEPGRCIAALDTYMARLASKGSGAINELREWVSADCVEAADREQGIYTLSAPTGTGKTLAMLRFGLLHAQKHGLRRIILVLPYLNLIDESARIYRDVFKEFPNNFVLEDHSVARSESEAGRVDSKRSFAELWTENWDAPIVITTNVQFLESLHANRPSGCRKLHRIGKSVVLMDEVQTIPHHLAPITLATLSNLAANFGSTIVFATATQPAFDLLDSQVKGLHSPGWQPKEMVKSVDQLFARSKRVNVHIHEGVTSWETLADEIAGSPGTLAIVNLKRHASQLMNALRQRVPAEQLFHLSTNMLTPHRRQVLSKLKEAGAEDHGWLVATQCVEAGVDLDFQRGFRAWGPMESLAQAAGRVNRNGRNATADFTIFSPPQENFPDEGYRQATIVAKGIAAELEEFVLHNPAVFRKYYSRLHANRGGGATSCGAKALMDGLAAHDFVEVAKHYKLIPETGVNIFVPLVGQLGPTLQAENEDLLAAVRKGVDRKTLRALQKFSVSSFLPKNSTLQLDPVRSYDTEVIPNWYVLKHPENYDQTVGLMTENFDSEYIV